MAELECFYVSLLIINGAGRYLALKKQSRIIYYETRSKEAEVVVTFKATVPEEKVTMTAVLKILTNQTTTIPLHRTACFPYRFCLFAGGCKTSFKFKFFFSVFRPYS